MNRTEKGQVIDELRERMVKSQLLIIADYKGITVEDFNDYRKKIFAKDGKVKVLKNRLAKIAIKGTPLESLAPHLKGTTAVSTSGSDLTGPAKVYTEFIKDREILKFKVACLNGEILDEKSLVALSKLPTKNELIAQLLGSMQAPIRNLVSAMAQIPRQIVNVLAAVRDQKEKA